MSEKMSAEERARELRRIEMAQRMCLCKDREEGCSICQLAYRTIVEAESAAREERDREWVGAMFVQSGGAEWIEKRLMDPTTAAMCIREERELAEGEAREELLRGPRKTAEEIITEAAMFPRSGASVEFVKCATDLISKALVAEREEGRRECSDISVPVHASSAPSIDYMVGWVTGVGRYRARIRALAEGK